MRNPWFALFTVAGSFWWLVFAILAVKRLPVIGGEMMAAVCGGALLAWCWWKVAREE